MPRYFFNQETVSMDIVPPGAVPPIGAFVVTAKNSREAVSAYLARGVIPQKKDASIIDAILECPFCKYAFSHEKHKGTETQAVCPSCGARSAPFTGKNPRGWLAKPAKQKKPKSNGPAINFAHILAVNPDPNVYRPIWNAT